VVGFRVRIDPTGSYLEDTWTNVPGELEIDIVASNGTVVQPISIKGTISHYYADWQADVDALKEARINQFAKAYGWLPLLIVPERREDLWRLANQASTDQLFRAVMPL
jgi:hypothetical protein